MEASGIDPLLSILVTTPMMFAFGWLVYLAVGLAASAGRHMSLTVLLTFALALVHRGHHGHHLGQHVALVAPGLLQRVVHDR